MEDQQIIELFWQRSEEAIAALDWKYGQALRAFSQHITGSPHDAEECVNDAYLGVWNSIPPKTPQHLPSYVRRIVRNLSINRYHKNSAHKRATVYEVALAELEAYLSCPDTVEARLEQAELTNIIEGFLAQLSTENRVIFLRRYWYADNYADIAERIGTSTKVVSVRLVRLRKQLAKYLTERGVDV